MLSQEEGWPAQTTPPPLYHHFRLLTPAALLKLGLSPAGKVLDLARGASDAAAAERGDEPWFRSTAGVRAGEPAHPLFSRRTRNTATVLTLQGFWVARPIHDPPHHPQGPV